MLQRALLDERAGSSSGRALAPLKVLGFRTPIHVRGIDIRAHVTEIYIFRKVTWSLDDTRVQESEKGLIGN